MTAKILIVDDDQLCTGLLRESLQCAGLGEIATVSTGVEALTVHARHSIWLTILDMDMPCMEGLTTLKRIRTMQPNAQVLVNSMLSPAIYASRCMRLGAIGYLDKRSTLELLPAIVQRISQRHVLFPTPMSDKPTHLLELTDQELIALRCLVRGGGDQAISRALAIHRADARALHQRLISKSIASSFYSLPLYAQSLGVC